MDVREYTPNLRTEFQGAEVFADLNSSGFLLVRDSPTPTESFWTVYSLGAFRADTTNEVGGCFKRNILLVYQWTLEAKRLTWNEARPDLQIEDSSDCSRRTTLHELGHAFGLDDKTGKQDKGIMSYKNMYTRLSPENLKFEDFELQLIQSKAKPV